MQRGFLFTKLQAGNHSLPARNRGKLAITCVATPSKPPAARLAKRSKVEIIKEKSDFLRHPLMEELVNENAFISEEAVQLMKFHGSYMQDHREKRAFGAGKAYMFMMRTRQPAGAVTNQLYLAMDDLADQVCKLVAAVVLFLVGYIFCVLVCVIAVSPSLPSGSINSVISLFLSLSVRQRHASPDNAPSVPAARCTQARPQDRLLNSHQEYGLYSGCVR